MATYSAVAVRRTPAEAGGDLPTFVGKGTKGHGTGAVGSTEGLTLPSGLQAGDTMLMFREGVPEATDTPTVAPDVWNHIGYYESQAAGFSDATTINVWWKEYEVGDSIPTLSDIGNHQLVVIYAWRGVDNNDVPHKWSVDGTSTNDTTVDQFSALLTLVDNCLIVAGAASGDSGLSTSSWANTSLTAVTKRGEDDTTAGVDGMLTVADGALATAGNSGTFTATITATEEEANMLIALPPAASNPTFQVLGPLVCSIEWTETLNQPSEGTFTMDVDGLQDNIKQAVADLKEEPLEVWVYRDDVLVFVGPVVGGEIGGNRLQLACRGIGFYMAYMMVTTNKDWVAEDQYAIVSEIIDDWQSLDYGHFGLYTTTIGTSTTTRNLSILGATEPTRVSNIVSELAESDNGFDWYVDLDARDLKLVAARGDDLSATVFLERGVQSPNIRFAVAPDVIASEVFATGTGSDSPITTTKSNTALRPKFGRSGTAITVDGDPDATFLGDAAQKALDLRGGMYLAPGPGLVAITGAGVDDFGVGDTVTYTFDAGLGQQTGAYRIFKRKVMVSDQGLETMTVEFE